MAMKIRTLFICSVVLVAAIVVTLGTLLFIDRSRIAARAQEALALTHVLRSMSALSESLTIGRGFTIILLTADKPSSEDAAAMLKDRAHVDDMMAALEATLATARFAEKPEIVAAVAKLQSELAKWRAYADAAAGQDRATRKAVSDSYVQGLFGLMAELSQMIATVQQSLSNDAPTAGKSAAIAQAAWEVRDNAGRQVTMFLQAVTSRKAVTPAQSRALDVAQGRIDRAWERLEVLVGVNGTSETLRQAFDVANRGYRQEIVKVREEIAPGLSSGRPYPYDGPGFRARTQPLLKTIMGIRDAALDETLKTASEIHSTAITERRIAIAVLAMTALLVALMIWSLIWRLTNPLSTLAETLRRISDGEKNAEIPFQGRRDEMGDISKAIASLQESRNRADARLRRNQQHLEHAQRVATTGSAERDLVTGTLEWSEELYRLHGVDSASFALTDTNMFGLIHEEDRARVTETITLARTGVRPSPFEYRIIRGDGQIRTLHVEMDVISDQAGKPARLLSVLQDVTELRAAEKRQKETAQQLQQAQKLEALGTLAGGVAHELNNTLVPVLGLAKLTARRLPEGSREQSNLVTILQAGEKARDLVERIVAFSRKEMPVRIKVDLAALTHDALALLRHSLPATIRVEERIAAVPAILGDPGQLPQILINLVINAVQATRDQTGTVLVELAPAPGERLPQVPERLPGLAIRLTVIDHGCGMDKATKARVFEPFFTTKPPGESTGLGLSVVYGIVTQHGGHIAVESEPGRGTRVDVYLPALAGAEITQQEGSALAAERPALTLASKSA